MTHWNIAQDYELNEASHTLQVLADRGVDPDGFFQLGVDSLHDPFLLKDMDRATLRAKEAIDRKEKIRIAGDYDADGITSTYTMMYGFRLLGADVTYQIPDRQKGYGLSCEMVDRAYREGCTLIVTCDNGIAAHEAVEHAKTLGVDVIVTDHHEPQELLPDTIVVNPKRKDCPYPFKELAGCAVAWKFIHALLSHYGRQDEAFGVMEMVATGTVADMMDIIGENRTLVAMGLEALQQPVNPGMHRLMEELELFKYPIESETLGFSIGPALNAAGRLSTAEDVVELFLTDSPIREKRLAQFIRELNEERKRLTETFAQQALLELDGAEGKVIVHEMAGIPEGIVGIIASRILKEKGRPVLLVTPDARGEYVKGSGRSVPGFDLFEAMSELKPLLAKFGGHAGACGFSLPPENVDGLRRGLNRLCTLTEAELAPAVDIDYAIEAHHLTLQMAEDFVQLEPTGRANRKPVFALSNCRVTKADFIGGNKKTLRLALLSGTTPVAAIGFNMADAFDALRQSQTGELFVDVACIPSINEWAGRKTLQVKIQAIRPSGLAQ